MTPSALVRASGLATIVGGLLFVLFPLLHPDHTAAGYTSWIWVPAHMAPNVGAILVLFGLVGLLTRQLEKAGLFGVIAFTFALPYYAAKALRVPLGKEPGSGLSLRERVGQADEPKPARASG